MDTLKTQDVERITHQFIVKNNWNVVDELDNFIYVFDKLPPRTKLVVDLKTQGYTAKEIADKMKCSLRSINRHLYMAKKRILRGENIG